MNFDLSEEQRMLQSTLDGLLEKEFPVASVREFYESDADLDPSTNRLETASRPN